MEKQPDFVRIKTEASQLFTHLRSSVRFVVQGIIGLAEARGRSQSENLDWLLCETTIKQLLEEGRIPFPNGRIGHWSQEGVLEWENYYQVPPKGFSPEQVIETFDLNGTVFFKFTDGSIRGCTTFSLTQEQAEWLNRQISACSSRSNK